MYPFETKIILAVLLFLLTIVSGFILKKKGKPYSNIVVNIHKLLSLAVIVVTVIATYPLFKKDILNYIQFVLIVISGILFIVALISGGLLTTEKDLGKWLLIVHRLSSLLLVVAFGWLVYLLY